MSVTRAYPRRRSFLVGAIGFCLGAVVTGLAAYSYFKSSSGPLKTSFHTAGKLHVVDAVDPKSDERDQAARSLADQVIDSIAKRDAAALAGLAETPFLGGAPHNLRIIRDRSALEACLRDDLCQGPYMPAMFATERAITTILSPNAFFERFADGLVVMGNTRKLLDSLALGPTDRLVVEDRRGMVVVVRIKPDGARVAGILPLGFQPPSFTVIRDLIYGRKFGAALTLDVLQPKGTSNRGVVLHLISDSFVSNPPLIANAVTIGTGGLLEAGYTVIFVTHSGAPKNSMSDIFADTQRAVRFVRYNAARLNIEPDRIAVMGGSSGGYLALMLGTGGDDSLPFPPSDDPTREGDRRIDPVEGVSSAVQAVISYYPPTDWLNYGAPGKPAFEHPAFKQFHALFDLYTFNNSRHSYDRIADRSQQLRLLKELSPVNRVSRNSAPTLLFHGDKDPNVPLQQSESMLATFKASGVNAELVVRPGAVHGWEDNREDTKRIVSWLDTHLPHRK